MEIMEMHNVEGGDATPFDADVTHINGKMYLLHTVEPHDSLTRLAIMYNVDAKTIRLVNKLPNDMIHHKEKLHIPMSDKFKHHVKAPMTEERALEKERDRRAAVVSMMSEYIARVSDSKTSNCKAEATFYCEENNYDFNKAKQAYEEDRKFEEEQAAQQPENNSKSSKKSKKSKK